MAIQVSDAMSGSNWDDIHERTGEVGASWSRHPVTPSSRWYIYGGKVHPGVLGAVRPSGVTASADYDVQADYTIYTDISGSALCGRMHATDFTFYYTYYQSGELVLAKMIAGTPTSIGWWISTLTGGGTTYDLRLNMVGTAIKVFVNGVQRISVTDGSITATGTAGLRSAGANDATTGKHIDNFLVYDASSVVVPTARMSTMIGI